MKKLLVAFAVAAALFGAGLLTSAIAATPPTVEEHVGPAIDGLLRPAFDVVGSFTEICELEIVFEASTCTIRINAAGGTCPVTIYEVLEAAGPSALSTNAFAAACPATPPD